MTLCHFNNNVEQPLRGQFKGFWKVHLLNVLHLYMTCCFCLKVEMTEACTRQKGHFFLYRHVLRYSETCFARLTNVFVRTALWSAVLPWLCSPYFWLILRCHVSLWLAVCCSTDPQPVAVVVAAAQHSQLTGFTDLQKGYCCFGPAGLQSLLTVNRAHLWPVCTWLQLWPSQRGDAFL